MSIKVKTRKLLVRSYPCRQILDFELLSKNQLPLTYVENYPSVFIKIMQMSGDRLVVKHLDLEIDVIEKGDKISEERFQKIVQTMKGAGMLLHQINAVNKKRYPEHYKKDYETIII